MDTHTHTHMRIRDMNLSSYELHLFLRIGYLCGWSTQFIMIHILLRRCGWKIISFEDHLFIHHMVAIWMVLVKRQICTSLYHLINGQMISKTHDFSSTTPWEHVDHVEWCGSSIHVWYLGVAHISLYELKLIYLIHIRMRIFGCKPFVAAPLRTSLSSVGLNANERWRFNGCTILFC